MDSIENTEPTESIKSTKSPSFGRILGASPPPVQTSFAYSHFNKAALQSHLSFTIKVERVCIDLCWPVVVRY